MIKIGAAGLSFVMFVALARAMPQEAFGHFGFAFSLATILAILGSVGQRNLVLRFASVYLDAGNDAAAFGVIRFSTGLVLAGSGLLALGLVAASFIVEQGALFRATAALTVALRLLNSCQTPQRAAGRVWLALLPRDILLRAVMIGMAGFGDARDHAADGRGSGHLDHGCRDACSDPWTGLLVALHPSGNLLRAQTDMSERAEWQKTMWGMWGNSA